MATTPRHRDPLSSTHRPDDRPAVAGRDSRPNALQRLHVERGQSAWLDLLTRGALKDGSLSRLIADGIRGVTANPAALNNAIGDSPAYDEQLSWLFSRGWSPDKAYLELAATDVQAACALLLSTYDRSRGLDGLVSLGLPSDPSRRTQDAVVTACRFHRRVDRPNFVLAIPATSNSIPVIRAMIAAGRSVNVTSIFSIDRYSTVIEAYLSGLETFIGRDGDPASVHSVASFPLSMVDAAVDRRLERLGDVRALELRGLSAVAQAKLAYRQFEEWFDSDRWSRLARAGANPQRPLWTSSAPGHETRCVSPYVEDLAVPNSVHALSESTVTALLENGKALPSLGIDTRGAAGVLSELAAKGVDLRLVGAALEQSSAATSRESFSRVLRRLATRRRDR
ncbi:MAG TPA: transaldolase family protein [Nocardioides sp.]|uniref:transaldolase family protein n=1 Tax=Nocardioides sp. TaxID=35761 RepID=UPI002E31BF88|nr:transaldolase family protein [Nocardioides sp.]HEX5087753.1 transaldolase family protein [Nocardioides sp.]